MRLSYILDASPIQKFEPIQPQKESLNEIYLQYILHNFSQTSFQTLEYTGQISLCDSKIDGDVTLRTDQSAAHSSKKPTIIFKMNNVLLSPTAAAELKQLEKNRRVTLSFFLVGVTFISTAIPTTLTASILGLHSVYGKFQILDTPGLGARA